MTDEGASAVGRRQRRWWSDEDKARIVAECDRPGMSVSLVARRHDLNANLLFSWRRQIRERQHCADEIAFIPAVIAPQEPAADRLTAAPAESQPVLASSAPSRPSGRIEIVLGGSRRIIVDGDVSTAALARVIGVLERR